MTISLEEAIRRAVEVELPRRLYGGPTEIAEAAGVSHQLLRYYVKKRLKELSPAHARGARASASKRLVGEEPKESTGDGPGGGQPRTKEAKDE